MVVASRQNLEDFCRAHGLSIDSPRRHHANAGHCYAGDDDCCSAAAGRSNSGSSVTPRSDGWRLAPSSSALQCCSMLRPWSTRDAPAPAPKPEPAASEPAAISPPQSNRRDRRRPRLDAMIETPPLASRPRRAASPWPPRSYAAPSRRVAAAGAAIRWANPRRRDRSSSSLVSGPRAMPLWCIAGIAETRCGNP